MADLREVIARVLYDWNAIVGPGGRGTVSYDEACEYHADFIGKHLEEADEILAAMVGWEPSAAAIENAAELHGNTPWSASDDSVYASLFRAMLQARTPSQDREA